MMAADDGKPVCGATKRNLGACIPGDLDVDSAGQVRPRTGGMSVTATSPRALPKHRRPPSWGGTGKDPVFGIDASMLGGTLAARPETQGSTHWFVEPAHIQAAYDYQRAIWTSRPFWEEVNP